MRVIRVDDEPEYGVALGSILVSLLEPRAGPGAAPSTAGTSGIISTRAA